jgi:hypothetical protein
MNKSAMLVSFFTVLLVVGLITYRLLWAASSIASAAGLGRLPKLPKGFRRWLFGEPNDPSHGLPGRASTPGYRR